MFGMEQKNIRLFYLKEVIRSVALCRKDKLSSDPSVVELAQLAAPDGPPKAFQRSEMQMDGMSRDSRSLYC